MSVDGQTQYAGYISGQTRYADCQWTCRHTRYTDYASGHADKQGMQTISVNTDRQGMRTMLVDRQTQYAGYISGQTWYADCQWTCRPTRYADYISEHG